MKTAYLFVSLLSLSVKMQFIEADRSFDQLKKIKVTDIIKAILMNLYYFW